MASSFRLGPPPTQPSATIPGGPFASLGFKGNPFPSAGVNLDVFYRAHMEPQIDRVDAWLERVEKATTGPPGQRGPAVSPLALAGALGVGKTHLLSRLERGLSAFPKVSVLRKSISDEGMTRLTLANLLLHHLPRGLGPEGEDESLVRSVARCARKAGTSDPWSSLTSGGPLAGPLSQLVRAPDGAFEALVPILERWSTRAYTTPGQRAKLGIAGTLEAEGQAIHVIADLMRLARHFEFQRVWYVLFDQLEDLWRPQVVTPGRRARFLTDLRILVDQALEGAPIALLLAWNTKVTAEPDAASQLQRDYRALWQRLGEPVDLPGLRQADLVPFALAYVDAPENHVASPDESATRARAEFRAQLEQEGLDLLCRTSSYRDSRLGEAFAPRQVLQGWHTVAEQLVRRARSPLTGGTRPRRP